MTDYYYKELQKKLSIAVETLKFTRLRFKALNMPHELIDETLRQLEEDAE